MANIGIDPHTLEAPDYASATYVESRQPLVEAGHGLGDGAPDGKGERSVNAD